MQIYIRLQQLRTPVQNSTWLEKLQQYSVEFAVFFPEKVWKKAQQYLTSIVVAPVITVVGDSFVQWIRCIAF